MSRRAKKHLACISDPRFGTGAHPLFSLNACPGRELFRVTRRPYSFISWTAPERKRSQHRTFLTLWSPAGNIVAAEHPALPAWKVPSVCVACSASNRTGCCRPHSFGRNLGYHELHTRLPTMLRSDSRETSFRPGENHVRGAITLHGAGTLMPQCATKNSEFRSRVAISERS